MDNAPDINELRRIESLRLAVQTCGGSLASTVLSTARQYESYLSGVVWPSTAEKVENLMRNHEAPIDSDANRTDLDTETGRRT